jgi:SHS2 domain-containing protein
MTEDRGWREVEHTADWELEVWAPDMATLLEEAARGMYALMSVELDERRRDMHELEVEAADRESLVVEFLAELLYLAESRGLAFDRMDLRLDGERMRAELEGAAIRGQGKEIKAVTYHRLEVQEEKRGLRTRIVFDV